MGTEPARDRGVGGSEVGGPRYLVCATQRSGSTMLCDLLKQTGVAGRPEEYFEAERATGIPPHPGHFLRGLNRTGAGIRDDPTPADAPAYSSLRDVNGYRRHLERTFAAGTTPNGVFAAKLMFNQIVELEGLAGSLPEYTGLTGGTLLAALFGDPVYVWVSRGDTVRQAVSLWKALQNRRWRGGAGGGGRAAELQYRFAGIDHLMRRLRAEEQGWRRLFQRHGILPLHLRYEDDLEGDPGAAVGAVLDGIGVDAPAGWSAGERLSRQADELSEEWVRRYHRDRSP